MFINFIYDLCHMAFFEYGETDNDKLHTNRHTYDVLYKSNDK